jgi:hypothetical protein
MASAVLVMESLTMGFALLLAKDDASSTALWLGGILAIVLLLTPGLLKRKIGFQIGSVLQVGLIAYGYVEFTMYFLGALFAALWIIAIVLGRKGEAIKARLIAERDGKTA